ncbi:MAG: hypothetical protein JWO05_3644 [Gemmatimonadetes bacterium]|nr:hypothetical protein [Gemmatimonadota bacterium]
MVLSRVFGTGTSTTVAVGSVVIILGALIARRKRRRNQNR